MKALPLLLPLLGTVALATAPQPPVPPAPVAPAVNITTTPISPDGPDAPAQLPANQVEIPVPVVQSAVTPPRLDGVEAALSAVPAGAGKVTLTLTLKNNLARALALNASRDSEQNCTYAPTVRALKVGSRVVAYPDRSARPRICTQEVRADTLAAAGTVVYTRDLELPAGEYMLEGWWTGVADGARARVPAQPVRVSVK